MTGTIAKRLADLKIELPKAQPPVANYVPTVIVGKQLYIAGQCCIWNGELRHVGELGNEVSITDGQEAARICALNILAHAQAALGDLDRVERCVKLNAFIRSSATFAEQPQVANGASDLFVEVFGESGKHARSVVGVVQLPRGASVEVDAVFQIA